MRLTSNFISCCTWRSWELRESRCKMRGKKKWMQSFINFCLIKIKTLYFGYVLFYYSNFSIIFIFRVQAIVQPYLKQLNSEAKRPIIKACAKLAYQDVREARHGKRRAKLSQSSSSSSGSSSSCSSNEEKLRKQKKKRKLTQNEPMSIPETQNQDPLQLSDNFFTQSEWNLYKEKD